MGDINRGGRGRKSENPSYCTDDTARDIADRNNKHEGSARLFAAIMLYHQKRAQQWGVSIEQAARITEGMCRASMDSGLRKVA